MNLVRLGHFHVPGVVDPDSGTCKTALVVKVTPSVDGVDYVNLAVWDENAYATSRFNVPVGIEYPTLASFHLSGDCPWGR